MSRHRSSRLPDLFRFGAAWGRSLAVLCLCAALPGCLLLSWNTGLFSEDFPAAVTEPANNVLGKIPTSRTAVTLEIVFVERPITHPLMGNQLWDEVDQIGSLPADVRQSLAKLGFRVGRVGANPPAALQTLMGLTTDISSEDEKRLVGRRVVLPSGAETEITTGVPTSRASINVPTTKGMEIKPFDNVRGVFRMKAKRLQEGWARIEFLPEIHHGRMVNRPVAVRGGWQLQTAQAIERLYGQEFSLDLNLGEMVVITANPQPEDSVGRHFFYTSKYTDQTAAENLNPPESLPEETPSETKPGIQRLLIVRLADLSTAKSLYAEQ